MQSHDNELLVESVSTSNVQSSSFEDVETPVNTSFSLKTLQETFVKDGKKNVTPDPEGNVNSAMDLFAPDQSSVSSTNSRLSLSSTLEPPNHLSSSSEPKDTSDSDRVGQFKVKIGNNYMTLLNEHDQLDAMSITSDSSFGEGKSPYGLGIYSPKNSPSTPSHPTAISRIQTSSPHFPSSSISFPSKTTPVKKWTVFGEDKENKLPGAGQEKLVPVRAPPAIPDRKSVQSSTMSPSVKPTSPVPASQPKADLLTMAMDDLEFHLADVSLSIFSPSKPVVPPRRNMISSTSTASGSGSHAEESDQELITLPGPECHINHAHLSSGSSSPADLGRNKTAQKSLAAPPIPPRKDFKPCPILIFDTGTEATESTSIFDGPEFDSSANFATFPSPTEENNKEEFSLDIVCSSPCWVNFDDSPVTAKEQMLPTSPLLSLPEITTNGIPEENQAVMDSSILLDDDDEMLDEEDNVHWKEPSSSPDIRASTSKKKGGGRGYLCLENDDFDNIMSSTENIGTNICPETAVVSLPANDKSPEKPQSQWATFQNEEDEDDNNNLDTLVDSISCPDSSPSFCINSSGLADSINDVDVELEDDFGLGINRLSTDMPDLKGFNRADKGSQNNLVDFSDDRGSAAASIGSQENMDDDDAETIFDLTAQGDSLKRRRPKQAIDIESMEEECDGSKDSSPREVAAYHVGPAGLDDDAVLAEEVDLFGPGTPLGPARTPTPHSSLSSRNDTPASVRLDSTDSATCSKNNLSTNPFWSPTSANAPDSTSYCSLLDSPFDKVVFKAPISSQPEAASPTKPSTPVRTFSTASPLTTGQIFRIPPPPASQSRSSTRSKRSSLAKERIRNLSHGSSSVRKLDLDSASDASIQTDSLPVSRAETPSIAVIKIDEPGLNEQSLIRDTPTKIEDNVFDPFIDQSDQNVDPAVSTVDPFASVPDTTNENLFEWIESTAEPAELGPSDFPGDLGQGEVDNTISDSGQDITLVLDRFDQAEIVPCNMNTNAQVPDETVPLDATINIEIPPEKDPGLETPDPLLELKKATSVESPNGIEISPKSFLPEVEIMDSRVSWDVFMRFPREKRTMSTRKWVPIHMRLNCDQIVNPLVKLFYTSKVKEPFHTVSLASHQMQLSKPKLQAHYSDEGQVLGKLHTVKLMVVNYKEKQTFSPRRSISRNPCGFKHACRGKQSIKFGFTSHRDIISFCNASRDAMFNVHKRVPKLKDEEHTETVKYHSRDELLIDVCDELQAVVNESGVMEACKVRVHLFACSFLSGDPLAKITLNDRKMEGREVVRREDIIPTSMDQWIDIRDPELHESCTADSYRDGSEDHVGNCVFYPPDACKFELMRFSTSYAEEELPVTIKASVVVKGARLQLRCVVRMSSKHSANKDHLTQIACEDVMIRFPVPDEWGAFFRVDGRFRNHSVRAKRAAKQRRRPSSEAGVTMEASVGVGKYEHAYRAVVWRLPRLPEKNSVQNTPRVFSCRIELGSDQDLERLRNSHASEESKGDGYRGGLDGRFRWCEVEYTMSGPTASNVCVRSMSLPNTDRAEKFVCYQSHYLYKVGMNLSAESVGTNGEEDVGTSICAVQ